MPTLEIIAFRLTSEQIDKLKQILQTMNCEASPNSENMRLLIEKLYQKLIVDKSQPTETVIRETSMEKAIVTQTPKEMLMNPPTCHFRAIDPKIGFWFCDLKRVNPFACLQRQKRFAYKERQCRPIGTRERKRQKFTIQQPSEDDFSKPYGQGSRNYYESQPLKPCPEGHSRSFCYANPCPHKQECRNEGIIS